MDAELAELFRALSDPTRLRLLTMLRADLCVGELAKRAGVSESTVSQHLGILRRAGLITGEKRSYWTHYTANTAELREIAARLEGLAELLDEPADNCEVEDCCPESDCDHGRGGDR
ncbi:MAG: ArsR/SmtB family transcription factor [Clostridia bacterium]